MTLQQLRYFCVMAEVLHYTKAANQLYISQPSLSYSLAELGKELGVPLFGKHGKKTYLTKYGAAFLPYAKNALAELSKGEATLLQIADPTIGNINFGYIYSVSFDMMPSLIEKFYEHQGNRNISFNFHQGTTSTLQAQLIDGSLDLILTTRSDNESVESLPVFEQELFLVVSDKHPLARRSSVTLDDIREEHYISINYNSALRMQIDSCFHDAELEPKTVIEVDDCNAMASFVGAQLGVAIMPKIPSLSNYKVVALPIRDLDIRREICLLWSKERPMIPAVSCFRDYIASANFILKSN